MTLLVEATVTSLAPGGDGVAHLPIAGERRAVFLSRTAPGDVLRAEVDASQRPARGRVLEVLQAGPARVAPACPFVDACGACDWMHLSVEAQAEAHAEHVRAALPPAWRALPVAVHAALRPLGYRTRVRVHVRCDRGRPMVGLYRPRSHDPVPVASCVVLDPALERARQGLAALFEGSRGRGDAQLALGAGRSPVLDLSWTGELAPAFFGRVEKAVEARELAGASVTMQGATAPAVVGDATPWMAGPDGLPLRLATGGFAQASEEGNAILAGYVARTAQAVGADRTVELFAGAGNLSVLLARAGDDARALVLVEADRGACEAARANLAARGLAARVVEANADDYVWGPTTRLVVLDPPRTGARAVAERLAASRVRHVVYVSCDAQTLGRDAALLEPAYEARSVATFEMFPQTSHVEAVLLLERKAKPGR